MSGVRGQAVGTPEAQVIRRTALALLAAVVLTACGETRLVDGGAGLGYAEIQAILGKLGDPGDAPHERFWKVPYAEFVDYRFPASWDNPQDMIKLLEPWNSGESNLVKALRDGRRIRVTKHDGKVVTINIPRMPKGGSGVRSSDIEKIELWIDAGCPEFGDKPSTLPRK